MALICRKQCHIFSTQHLSNFRDKFLDVFVLTHSSTTEDIIKLQLLNIYCTLMLQCKINFSAVNDFAFLHCRTICGLSQATTKSHICRAALEAVCFQTREVSEHDFLSLWKLASVLRYLKIFILISFVLYRQEASFHFGSCFLIKVEKTTPANAKNCGIQAKMVKMSCNHFFTLKKKSLHQHWLRFYWQVAHSESSYHFIFIYFIILKKNPKQLCETCNELNISNLISTPVLTWLVDNVYV